MRPVAAYPSGHAIRAIAGVHYPEDVVSGQRLGNVYADVIVRQPAFKQAIAGIRDQDGHAETGR